MTALNPALEDLDAFSSPPSHHRQARSHSPFGDPEEEDVEAELLRHTTSKEYSALLQQHFHQQQRLQLQQLQKELQQQKQHRHQSLLQHQRLHHDQPKRHLDQKQYRQTLVHSRAYGSDSDPEDAPPNSTSEERTSLTRPKPSLAKTKGQPPQDRPPTTPSATAATTATSAANTTKTALSSSLPAIPPLHTAVTTTTNIVAAVAHSTPRRQYKKTILRQQAALLAAQIKDENQMRDSEATRRVLARTNVIQHVRSLQSRLAYAQYKIELGLEDQPLHVVADLFDQCLGGSGSGSESDQSTDSDAESLRHYPNQKAASHGGQSLASQSPRDSQHRVESSEARRKLNEPRLQPQLAHGSRMGVTSPSEDSRGGRLPPKYLSTVAHRQESSQSLLLQDASQSRSPSYNSNYRLQERQTPSQVRTYSRRHMEHQQQQQQQQLQRVREHQDTEREMQLERRRKALQLKQEQLKRQHEELCLLEQQQQEKQRIRLPLRPQNQLPQRHQHDSPQTLQWQSSLAAVTTLLKPPLSSQFSNARPQPKQQSVLCTPKKKKPLNPVQKAPSTENILASVRSSSFRSPNILAASPVLMTARNSLLGNKRLVSRMEDKENTMGPDVSPLRHKSHSWGSVAQSSPRQRKRPKGIFEQEQAASSSSLQFECATPKVLSTAPETPLEKAKAPPPPPPTPTPTPTDRIPSAFLLTPTRKDSVPSQYTAPPTEEVADGHEKDQEGLAIPIENSKEFLNCFDQWMSELGSEDVGGFNLLANPDGSIREPSTVLEELQTGQGSCSEQEGEGTELDDSELDQLLYSEVGEDYGSYNFRTASPASELYTDLASEFVPADLYDWFPEASQEQQAGPLASTTASTPSCSAQESHLAPLSTDPILSSSPAELLRGIDSDFGFEPATEPLWLQQELQFHQHHHGQQQPSISSLSHLRDPSSSRSSTPLLDSTVSTVLSSSSLSDMTPTPVKYLPMGLYGQPMSAALGEDAGADEGAAGGKSAARDQSFSESHGMASGLALQDSSFPGLLSI